MHAVKPKAEEQCIMLEEEIRLCRGTDIWDSPVLKPPCCPTKISSPYIQNVGQGRRPSPIHKEWLFNV